MKKTVLKIPRLFFRRKGKQYIQYTLEGNGIFGVDKLSIRDRFNWLMCLWQYTKKDLDRVWNNDPINNPVKVAKWFIRQ